MDKNIFPSFSSKRLEDPAYEEYEEHSRRCTYDTFQFTDAIRPVFPYVSRSQEGYLFDTYVDNVSDVRIPVMMTAVTRAKLFETFLGMLDVFEEDDAVDVVLETSHDGLDSTHEDLYREHIDLPVAKSIFIDYENLLLNDGFTGVVVLRPDDRKELQFTEHKMIILYGNKTALSQGADILRSHSIVFRPDMKFLNEFPHVHLSSQTFRDQFEQLKIDLGVD